MDVDVEHVLPKSVVNKLIEEKNLTTNVKAWLKDLGFNIPDVLTEKSKVGKSLEGFLNRLGNQALLNDKANRGAKDLPFDKKKCFYKKQALTLTNSLTKYDQWDLKKISERQKEMAKEAPGIWRK